MYIGARNIPLKRDPSQQKDRAIAMTTAIDYADTQAYLQHFHQQGCQSEIIDNTEGLFNLCWFYVDIIDQLKLELEKKQVNIVRLKELISGMNTATHSSTDDEGNANRTKRSYMS